MLEPASIILDQPTLNRRVVCAWTGRADDGVTMDFELNDEQKALQSTVREFARQEIAPYIREFDESQEFPREIMAKAA